MKPEKVEIRGRGFDYQALVGREVMARIGELVPPLKPGRTAAVIADENSARLFAETVTQSLRQSHIRATLLTVPPGERSKSLAQVEHLCQAMVRAGLDRTSFVVGVGGGMIGDLSGFAAAIFHRGIPHVQIPTTLLAMVDSAIGGKTGVNLAHGKNLCGAIHQPMLVLADIAALDRLPAAELRQGYAEIIKHGIIRDAVLLRDVAWVSKSRLSAPSELMAEAWQRLIARNIRLKAEIVAADEHEQSGERALLNFGHTVGHAIEQAAGFRLPHGDCVSLGMVAACAISSKRAGLPTQERDEVMALLKECELPTRLPSWIVRDAISEVVGRDKKFVESKIRFIVTPRLGRAHLTDDVTNDDLCEAIARL